MDHSLNAPPVPTSVLEFHTENNNQGHPGLPQGFANLARPPMQQPAGPSSQPPQFTSDGHYASQPRPVSYSHGYPTPPSGPVALAPSGPEPRPSTPRGALFSTEGHLPTHAPYPTPPPVRQPDAQRARPASLSTMPPIHLQERFLRIASGSVPVSRLPMQRGPPSSSQPPTPTDSYPCAPPLSLTPQGPFMSVHPPPSLSWAPSQSSSHLPTPIDPHPPRAPRRTSQGSHPPTPIRAASLTLPSTSTEARVPVARPLTSGPPGSVHPPPPNPNPNPNRNPYPHPFPAPSAAQQLPTPLPAVLAAEKLGFEARIQCLEDALGQEDDLCRTLRAAWQRAQEDAKRASAAVQQLGAEVTQLKTENERLRKERDEARGQCERLRLEFNGMEHARDAAREMGWAAQRELAERLQVEPALRQELEDRAQRERTLQRELEEQVQARRREQEVANATLRHFVVQTSQYRRSAMQTVAQLTKERDALNARLAAGEGVKVDPGGEAPFMGTQQTNPLAADLVPKPEPLDDLDLELQYPPETPEAAPIAPDADGSTYYTWDPPPDQDRKRRREEYDEKGADVEGRAAVRARLLSPTPSLGPAFPAPRAVDVKTLNSPVHYFMQIRRKGG
ncbi:hypothetical protein FB451DRAFT_1430380 [Mycena latifolia]|nr:hypothetical protein FB451DRAFT_1430380 [Mycena latifolia]